MEDALLLIVKSLSGIAGSEWLHQLVTSSACTPRMHVIAANVLVGLAARW